MNRMILLLAILSSNLEIVSMTTAYCVADDPLIVARELAAIQAISALTKKVSATAKNGHRLEAGAGCTAQGIILVPYLSHDLTTPCFIATRWGRFYLFESYYTKSGVAPCGIGAFKGNLTLAPLPESVLGRPAWAVRAVSHIPLPSPIYLGKVVTTKELDGGFLDVTTRKTFDTEPPLLHTRRVRRDVNFYNLDDWNKRTAKTKKSCCSIQ